MQLYDWQKKIAGQGKRILEDHHMLYLGLFPRTGKSLIVMDIINNTYTKPKVLFATTKSAIPGIQRVYNEMNMQFDMMLTNYESLHKLKHDTYNVIVLDEAHSKISKFPKPSKARKELERFNAYADIIWLSGTPKIESNSKLFHQIALSPYHKWSKYKNFYRWHDDYGIKGLTIYCGGPRPAIDYSQTVDLTEDIADILITDARTAVEAFKLHKVSVSTPEEIRDLYDQVKRHSIGKIHGKTVVAEGGAGRQTKLLQIAGGSVICDDDTTELISNYKAKAIALKYPAAVVFYKFQGEYELLRQYFEDSQLYQIDASATGLDLSHFDEAVIYTPTFSGSNFTQVLNRLCNVTREDIPNIYMYCSDLGIEEQVITQVLKKYDENLKFLEG